MSDQISDKDKKDWQNFISKKERLPNKDEIYIKNDVSGISEIDLHGFTLDEANKEIKKFIIENFNKGINKIRIVTGKGLHSNNEKNPFMSKDLSILRYSVPDYIKKNEDLMNLIINFKEASIEDGGEGAFYIYLKKNINK